MLTDRTWLRSHEEETSPVRVYRPADHAFPPARGRDGFTLHGDGRFDHVGPGRGDAPVTTPGTWHRDGDLVTATVAGATITMEIVEEGEDVLRVHWSAG